MKELTAISEDKPEGNMAFWETFCAWLLFYFVIQHISYRQWRNKAFKAFVMLSERYSTNACYIRSNHCGLNHKYFHGGMLFSDSLHFLKLFLFNIIFWTQSMNMSVFCFFVELTVIMLFYNIIYVDMQNLING